MTRTTMLTRRAHSDRGHLDERNHSRAMDEGPADRSGCPRASILRCLSPGLPNVLRKTTPPPLSSAAPIRPGGQTAIGKQSQQLSGELPRSGKRSFKGESACADALLVTGSASRASSGRLSSSTSTLPRRGSRLGGDARSSIDHVGLGTTREGGAGDLRILAEPTGGSLSHPPNLPRSWRQNWDRPGISIGGSSLSRCPPTTAEAPIRLISADAVDCSYGQRIRERRALVSWRLHSTRMWITGAVSFDIQRPHSPRMPALQARDHLGSDRNIMIFIHSDQVEHLMTSHGGVTSALTPAVVNVVRTTVATTNPTTVHTTLSATLQTACQLAHSRIEYLICRYVLESAAIPAADAPDARTPSHASHWSPEDVPIIAYNFTHADASCSPLNESLAKIALDVDTSVTGMDELLAISYAFRMTNFRGDVKALIAPICQTFMRTFAPIRCCASISVVPLVSRLPITTLKYLALWSVTQMTNSFPRVAPLGNGMVSGESMAGAKPFRSPLLPISHSALCSTTCCAHAGAIGMASSITIDSPPASTPATSLPQIHPRMVEAASKHVDETASYRANLLPHIPTRSAGRVGVLLMGQDMASSKEKSTNCSSLCRSGVTTALGQTEYPGGPAGSDTAPDSFVRSARYPARVANSCLARRALRVPICGKGSHYGFSRSATMTRETKSASTLRSAFSQASPKIA